MERNSINDCDSFKFIISFRGGHCDYLPQVPKRLAMPLERRLPSSILDIARQVTVTVIINDHCKSWGEVFCKKQAVHKFDVRRFDLT